MFHTCTDIKEEGNCEILELSVTVGERVLHHFLSLKMF